MTDRQPKPIRAPVGALHLFRLYEEVSKKFDSLFSVYGIARTGDDIADHRRLALCIASKLYQEFTGIFEDQSLLDLLFPLYGVSRFYFPSKDGPDLAAYRRLISLMAQRHGTLRHEEKPPRPKPSDKSFMIHLLADAENLNGNRILRIVIQLLAHAKEINSDTMLRIQPYSDNQIAEKLVEKEPYKTRRVNQKTLRNWLSDARKLERNWLSTMRRIQRESEPVMRAYEALVHPEKKGNET
jgi:hypothetical protein